MSTSAPSTTHVVLGSGPAGTALAAELARRGHGVRLVNRSGDGPPITGVQRVAADVSTAEGARAAIEGAAVAYHCVNVAYHRQVELMPGIQQAILAGAEANGARLVVLDTLYPYGRTNGVPMTEESPWNATGPKGRMRARLDEAYLAAHRSGAVSTALGRSGDFYGPGVLTSALGATTFPGALTGGAVIAIGDIDLRHSYTFIGDVASGLATLGEHREHDGRIWHLPTAPALTTRAVHRLIEERVGGPLQLEVLQEARPWGPFDQEFMDSYAELFYQHTETQIVDSGAFERAFATSPTPMAEGLDATIAWFRTWLAAQQGA